MRRITIYNQPQDVNISSSVVQYPRKDTNQSKMGFKSIVLYMRCKVTAFDTLWIKWHHAQCKLIVSMEFYLMLCINDFVWFWDFVLHGHAHGASYITSWFKENFLSLTNEKIQEKNRHSIIICNLPMILMTV